MNVKTSNLDDLLARYWYGTGAPKAAALLGETPRRIRLGEILEQPRSVNRLDQKIRTCVDDLLGFYSLLEVAARAALLPDPLPAPMVKMASGQLDDDDLRRYYEHWRPRVLPIRLRERVGGRRGKEEVDESVTTLLFLQFLDMNALVEDEDVNDFVSLLEDDGHGAVTLSDMLPAFDRPQDFFEHLAAPGPERSPLDNALQGFHKFLGSCRDFERLLAEAQQYRALQAAMWEFRFGELERHRGTIALFTEEAASRVGKWEGSTKQTSWTEKPDDVLHAVVRVMSVDHRLPEDRRLLRRAGSAKPRNATLRATGEAATAMVGGEVRPEKLLRVISALAGSEEARANAEVEEVFAELEEIRRGDLEKAREMATAVDLTLNEIVAEVKGREGEPWIKVAEAERRLEEFKAKMDEEVDILQDSLHETRDIARELTDGFETAVERLISEVDEAELRRRIEAMVGEGRRRRTRKGAQREARGGLQKYAQKLTEIAEAVGRKQDAESHRLIAEVQGLRKRVEEHVREATERLRDMAATGERTINKRRHEQRE
jgi:hypothetical protein